MAPVNDAPMLDVPPPRLSWRPWLLALALWLVTVLVAGAALWQMRQQAEAGQLGEVVLLSTALADNVARVLRGAEGSMRALGAQIGRGQVPVSGAEADRALRSGADLMHLVHTLWLVDPQGRLLAGSHRSPPPDVRTFDPSPDTLTADAVAVSRPYIDPLSGAVLVALATPMPAPDGRARGWTMAAVPAEQLLGSFNAATLQPQDQVAIYRNDGVRLAGVHLAAASSDDEAAVARRLAAAVPAGLQRRPDGTLRLVGLHAVAGYGLQVGVSRDMAALLAGWRTAVLISAVALLLLLAVTAAAVAVVQRADRRRALVQQSLQLQRARAGRLESLGTLAGGVAHDFNNVLAAIVGFCEMAQDAAAPASAQARHLGKLMQAALRGKSLVERILSFSRGGARHAVVFELAPVVTEVLTVVGGSAGSGVTLVSELQAPGARLRGDPTRLFEALLNLCTNAVQASAAAGRVQVTLTRHAPAAPAVLSHGRLAPGDWLLLSVSDEGPGIAPAVLERLFEPFFTTRGAEGGTGLGLAVVHAVVAEFGGVIDVRNLPQGGACFSLYLPETQAPATPADQALPDGRRGTGQRVLVLDDEPELAALGAEMLTALGYAAAAFTDPQAALAALHAPGAGFAAVVTDEAMPAMSGTRFIEALRPAFPALPVVLVSGHGGALLAASAARAAGAGTSRVLAKPVQRAELAAALAALLH